MVNEGERFCLSHAALKRGDWDQVQSTCAVTLRAFKQAWPLRRPPITSLNTSLAFLLSFFHDECWEKNQSMPAVILAAPHNPLSARDWNRMEFETF